MPEILRFYPHRGDSLAWDLKELLALVGDEGEKLHWRDAIGGSGTEFFYHVGAPRQDAVELWHRIGAERNGLTGLWPELLDIAANIFQTGWLTLLGFDSPETPELASLFEDKWGTSIGRRLFSSRRSRSDSSVPTGVFRMAHAGDDVVRERFRHSLSG